MQWWDSYRAVYGTELRAEAMVLADHGWAVVPGTFPQGEVWSGCADAPQAGPCPVLDEWALRASTDCSQIAEWWSGLPYSILLPTGLTFDVLEVPATVGRRAAAVLRALGVPVPIAATPTGEWLFPVGAGEPLRPDLAERGGISLHGRGSWFAAPPSTYPQGSVHWRVRPSACGWNLPDPFRVQDALAEAVAQRPAVAGGGSTYRLATVATGVRS
ncbi:bifunctional DNA primase/polymerase [Actinomycetospora callitridis]|jgi:hypothetical protein|uniref:bifunctional DNA primase/polymerase n=1 Tax=Actinomycetospora callitridis TaxID=913944 RepID=UPI002365370C|nr:bifunctional DNA primase/polymerase [Actinomycetospora callitridis]MDD7920859.1 bifunctional DNA primase/polymerase [Actinomycetospora callitridis]